MRNWWYYEHEVELELKMHGDDGEKDGGVLETPCGIRKDEKKTNVGGKGSRRDK